MNKLLLLLSIIVFGFDLNAQVPQAFSFQGLALDAAGKPVSDQTIALEIKLTKDASGLESFYEERHTTTTNAQGLYALSIGKGNVTKGIFDKIDWSQIPVFISVSIDVNGGSSLVLAGISQLLSVPYALRAGEANIKPRIFVKNAPNYVPATLINSGIASASQINYVYQWVDGTPENIYVEMKELPANIGISTTGRGSYSLLNVIKNYSNVDTIVDGIGSPHSSFFIIDNAIKIPPGKYPITLIFKTDKEILATIPYEIVIIETIYDECTPVLPTTLTRKSNTCSELDALIVPEITLQKVDSEKISSTNIFDNTKQMEIRYSGYNCSHFSSFFTQNIPNVGLLTFERLEVTKDKVTFGYSFRDSAGNSKMCLATY